MQEEVQEKSEEICKVNWIFMALISSFSLVTSSFTVSLLLSTYQQTAITSKEGNLQQTELLLSISSDIFGTKTGHASNP